ncbi:hypothetical protein P879_02309 [Paragonimus westermani]|uniref:Band 7 domain-containing protein n=1 Tax=Paragonimus westermani TaxID=34504 RepID=A0A8T0DL06_9TREM|nr:hypothetical protein P879_02309 [Paragonimus westermani]
MSTENLESGLTGSNGKLRKRKHTQSNQLPTGSTGITDEHAAVVVVTQMPCEVADLEPESHGFCGYFIICLITIISICLFPLTIWCSIIIIQSYERGIMLRLGKLRRQNGSPVFGSGIQFKLPCIDQLIKVDMRTVTVSIPPQEVLTKDSVTVAVDAVVYMRVVDPASAILRVEKWKTSTELLSVSILRTVIGNYSLAELLTCREEIDARLRRDLDQATEAWGIKVSRLVSILLNTSRHTVF